MRFLVAVFAASILLGCGVAVAKSPTPVGPASTASGAAAMQGEWMMLGPVSMAHLPLMMEFTFQDAEPKADAMVSARLTQEQQQQVLDARRRAAANPNDPDLIEMQASLVGLQEARMVIGPDKLTAKSGDAVNVVTYKVVSEDGLVVNVKTTESQGVVADLLITLMGPGLLMMGPAGQEPLVLRRAP